LRQKEKSRLTIVGVIPARSGSKGIPNKNIRHLCGKPLIYYTIKAALASRFIQRVIVSTDSIHIADIAKAYGAEVPFLRPAELVMDETPRVLVIRHAVRLLEQQYGVKNDIVVTLQPTSPLRTAEHIDAAIKLMLRTKAQRVVSVCEAEHSPCWMRRLEPQGTLIELMPQRKKYARRQDLPKIYRLNGAIFADTYPALMKEDLQNSKPTAFIMERKDSIDIDDELDFQVAEMLLQKCRIPTKPHRSATETLGPSR